LPPRGVRSVKASHLHQLCQNFHVPAGELRHHLPKCGRQRLPPRPFGRLACGLQTQRLVLQAVEGLQHRPAALLVEAAADMVQRSFVKMLDEPVKLIFHLQVHNNIRVLFKVHRLHLQHLGTQSLNGRE
jgi:hypothetical protein